MADLQTKYQKLAGEFAKLRAQNQVLKKAVVEEQEKQNALKGNVNEKDQKIRKSEQEIDSLSFRNQQLTKRVNVLQDELEAAEGKGKKNKSREADHGMSNRAALPGVMNEELRSKIEENERLHKQVYESTQSHQQAMMQLQDKLSNLESLSSQHQSVLESSAKKHQETVDRLQQEKAMLEVKLQAQEKEAREATLKCEGATQKLSVLQEELGGKVSWMTHIIQTKLPFNDTEKRELNALNVPTHDRKHQMKTKDLIGQAHTLVKELCSGLSNLHTYTEQRSKLFPIDSTTGPISAVNLKFCSYLHENASYLRPVEQAFKNFLDNIRDESLTTLETATELQDFSAKFSRYFAYLEKLLPYQLLSLEEECAISTCPQTLETRNMELHESFKRFNAAFAKLNTYLTALAAVSTQSCDHPQANHRTFFEKLSECCQNLSSVMKDVSKNYNFKVSLEHQLPTASQKLRTTDECIVSSFISLVTCTGKIANFTKSNLEFLSTPPGFRTRGHTVIGTSQFEGAISSPAVSAFRQKAVDFITTLSKPCPDSVPYDRALRNQRILLSSTESQTGLAQQLAKTSEKVSQLEQDREHWKLEAQLVQIKLAKEIQKCVVFESELKRLRAGGGKVVSPIDQESMVAQAMAKAVEVDSIPSRASDKGKAEPQIDTSMLGQLEGITMDFGESDETSRENLIKSHYTTRLAQLTAQRQVVDGKVVNFSSESMHPSLSPNVHPCPQPMHPCPQPIRPCPQSIHPSLSPCILALSPCILALSPYVLALSPYILPSAHASLPSVHTSFPQPMHPSLSPCIFTLNPCILALSPYVLALSPCILPSAQMYILAPSPCILALSPYVLALSPYILPSAHTSFPQPMHPCP
ncbi:protein phosphatase 1 regulatory subunit 21-like [Patiria miniata]|uniref:Protein phosphatase 1 regulatory subunit 21 n=1 Tax=Patiria miniata TaxID=46514 RepID=A0A913Z939_PATMI|nr:protein phosphatase 1 regulatory subunit 21-like [Patiria miniata]